MKPLTWLLLLTLYLGAGSREAQAITFNIANGDVAGIAAAIDAANINGEDDIIELASSGTYTLSALNNTTDGPNGLPVVGSDTGHTLTLNAHGATLVRAAAAPDLRLLYIGQSAAVILNSLNLSNGKASGASAGGGAMAIDRATVEANGCTISGNTAASLGGAIYCNGQGAGNNVSLTLSDCTLASNTANPSTGGAIYSNGSAFGSATLSLDGCTFTDNYATQYGGAIYNDGSVFGDATANITDCKFNGNRTENDGGAINCYGDSGSTTVNLTSCTFKSNDALHGYGGGIYSTGTSGAAAVTLTGCTLTQNSANTFGGGIYVYANSGVHSLELTDCTLDANEAVAGGGLYSDGSVGSAELTVARCTFSGNSGLSGGGGAIYNSGSFSGSGTATVTNSTFSANTATAGSNGGAIYNDGYSGQVDLTLLNNTFNSNTATNGCDVYNDGDSGTGATVQLANTIFAGGSGGSLYDFHNAGTITSQGHNISQDSGGGYLTGNGDLPNTDSKLDTAGLRDNGGPTNTIALLPDSPALNAGDDALSPLTDQRGVARPQASTVDIGALEERFLGISGLVRTSSLVPIAGATVTMTPVGGGNPPVDITSSTGSYSVTNLPEGVYTVSVSLTGFSFAPATQGLRLNAVNRGANFIGTRAAPTYSVSGRIATSDGQATTAVSVALVPALGGIANPVTTNSAGYYTFSGVPDGSYTITPSKSGYTFAPINRSVTIAGGSQSGLNFTGMNGHTIIGRIMLSNGAAIPGVTVTRTGAGAAPVTTNSAGYYTFINVPDGSITVTPSKATYIFTPSNKVVAMAGADVQNQNFIGATGYTVTGRIATSSGAAIGGVDVQIDGGATVQTNSAGYFTFQNVADGSHTVVPSKSGYTFAPVQKTVPVSGGNVGGQNFIGTGP